MVLHAVLQKYTFILKFLDYIHIDMNACTYVYYIFYIYIYICIYTHAYIVQLTIEIMAILCYTADQRKMLLIAKCSPIKLVDTDYICFARWYIYYKIRNILNFSPTFLEFTYRKYCLVPKNKKIKNIYSPVTKICIQIFKFE